MYRIYMFVLKYNEKLKFLTVNIQILQIPFLVINNQIKIFEIDVLHLINKNTYVWVWYPSLITLTSCLVHGSVVEQTVSGDIFSFM